MDARVSFELVGSSTSELDFVDPIVAARAWLTDPVRGAMLPEQVTTLAARTIDLAESHLRELDMLAGQVALDANNTGIVDVTRLEQLDMMSSAMRRYAERLRDVLDDAGETPDHVARRIDAALAAARHGGFDALVASL